MFFATDIANFLACQHIATLEREERRERSAGSIMLIPGLSCSKSWGWSMSRIT
jgi:hypothetical protein